VELFVIHCTTCRARLKVHDPAVIGQIVECPKCRSFVAVTAPPDWQSSAGSPSPAGTQPKATGGTPAPTAVAGPKAAPPAPANLPVARAAPPPLPKKSGSSVSGISSSSFIKPTPAVAAPPTGRAAAVAGAWAPTVGQPSTPAGSEPAAEVTGSNPQMASAAMLLGRYRWWVVGGAVAVASVATVALVLGRSHSGTTPAELPPVVERAAEQATSDKMAQASDDPVRHEPVDDTKKDQAAPKTLATEPAPAALAEADERSGGKDAAPAAPQTPASPPALPAGGDEPSPGAVAADVAPLMPEVYGTAGGKSPEALTAGPADRSTTAAPEEGLNEGDGFDPIKQARLMTHLQDKLPAFEFASVPLGQFVAFLSEFSTVPMVVDTQSLAEAGKSAKTRISVKMDDATVEEALKAALDKPGLTFHIEPGHLVITSRAAKSK
jgi:hypothetical protein